MSVKKPLVLDASGIMQRLQPGDALALDSTVMDTYNGPGGASSGNTTLEAALSGLHSRGNVFADNSGLVTANGNTAIDIIGGTFAIRSANSHSAPLQFITVPSVINLNISAYLAVDDVYVYLNYLNGSTIQVSNTNPDVMQTDHTVILLAEVHPNDTLNGIRTIHDVRLFSGDNPNQFAELHRAVFGVLVGGQVTSIPATLKLAMSAGTFFNPGFNNKDVPLFDSSSGASFKLWWQTGPNSWVNTSGSSFTASISGTTLTVTGNPVGLLAAGQSITDPAVASGTFIRNQLTGVIGGAGTYLLSIGQTVTSRALTSVQTGIDNYQYCNGTTLVQAGTNKYVIFYQFRDRNGAVNVLYGQNNYNTISLATADALPPLPTALTIPDHCYLMSNTVYLKSATVGIVNDLANRFNASQTSASLAGYAMLSGGNFTGPSTFYYNGDYLILGNELSHVHFGSWNSVASGTLYALAGDFIVWYRMHNVTVDNNGNILGREVNGICELSLQTEGGLVLDFSAVTGAAGTVPVFTLVKSFSFTTGVETATQFVSNVATGTAPFVVNSTTPVANLSIGGNAATVTTNANLTGEVTSVGNASTITNSAVIGKVITGFTSGAGAVLATDTILQAIQKLDGNTAALSASVSGALVYQGVWNATTNIPTLVNGTGIKGKYYKVSVAGTTSIDGITQWNIGDMIVFNGTTWDKIDGVSTEVTSVAGRVGAVTLAQADIAGLTTTSNPTFATVSAATFTGNLVGNADTVTTNANLSGDVTSVGNITTLANSGVTAGTYGDNAHIPSVTVDSKGRVTGINTVAVSIVSALSGLSDVAITTPVNGNILIYVSGTNKWTNTPVPTWNQNTTGSAATVTAAAQPNITSVGTLTSLTVSGTLSLGSLNTSGLNSNGYSVENIAYVAATATSASIALKTARGTLGSPTATNANDVIGNVDYFGYNANGFAYAASLDCVASGAFTNTSTPTQFKFNLTPVNAIVPVNVGIMDSTGKLTMTGSIQAPSIVSTGGIIENNSVISSNYTITAGNNASSAGPITIANGVVVTVPSGSRWIIG